ncbi:AI-2E family transporter [Eremococcus coleocola]|uniref:AI-2E family transporter n=1 Tax=Eremococcus coleocola TaxID=88132 RepID=UPI00041A0BCE|nr:AI-2E family transporter [Eremococcus coleocola]
MKKDDRLDRLLIKYIIFIAFIILILLNHQVILAFFRTALNVLKPIFIGGVLAFIFNIIMKQIEKIYFTKSDAKWVKKTRRPVSLLLAIITVLLVLVFVLNLVIPQLVSVVLEIVNAIPKLVDQVQRFIVDHEDFFPPLAQAAENFDIQNITGRLVEFLNNLSQNLIGRTVATITTTLSGIVNGILALMLAIYILLSKEKLAEQFNRLGQAYLPAIWCRRLHYVLDVANRSFTGFIGGQLIEALIIGSLVSIGMMIFRFPYPSMIGALTGVTAVIPVLGAYISGVVGFLLISVQSPLQGLAFLVFIIVLQQIEGNIIYPKVVGGKLGLPALWILAAVTVGGGLFGIMGMLFAVPITSTLYTLIKNDVAYREAQMQPIK